jgi:hypothetical protein
VRSTNMFQSELQCVIRLPLELFEAHPLDDDGAEVGHDEADGRGDGDDDDDDERTPMVSFRRVVLLEKFSLRLRSLLPWFPYL